MVWGRTTGSCLGWSPRTGFREQADSRFFSRRRLLARAWLSISEESYGQREKS